MRQLGELLRGLPAAQVTGPTELPIGAVTYDSRLVQPGALFVAIKGTHTDGHRYVEQAVAAGAAALVVDERYWNRQPWGGQGPPTLAVVPNSLAALAPIAAAFYGHPGRELEVVGITGTKGKTTTTALATRVLEASGQSVGSMGTLEFQIGARRWANDTRQSTLEAPEIQRMLREMLDEGCRYAVLEATSHGLSERWNRLGSCYFDVAVCTNVTHEHLDYHGSVEQYRRDKARLFEMMGAGERPAPPRALWAIVNADDPHHQLFLDAAPGRAQQLRYGAAHNAEVRVSAVVSTPAGSGFHVDTPWGSAEIRLLLPGAFNIHNALAALSVGLSQGIPLERCAAALGSVGGVRGRMERVDQGQPFGVIVDYAHNPDSFEQVLGMFRPLTAGRMIVLFGSAGERDRAKRPLQGAIAARYCELLVLADEDPRGEGPETILAEIAAGAAEIGHRPGIGYVCIPDRATALRFALEQARPGDLVLLLGKGHESSIQYADHSLPWDEASEARAALAALGYR